MIKTNVEFSSCLSSCLLICSLFSTHGFADNRFNFDEDSYNRQQSQADKAFQEMEREFETEASRSQFNEPPPDRRSERRAEKTIERKAAPRVTQQPVPAPRPIRVSIPPPASPLSDSIQTVSSNGYLFSLKGCKLIQHSVKCSLKAVDDEFDGRLLVYNNYRRSPSQMIDNIANEYRPVKLMMKNKETTGEYMEVLTLRNVETDFALSFDNFSGKASSIHTLLINAYNRRLNKYFSVKFSDVALN